MAWDTVSTQYTKTDTGRAVECLALKFIGPDGTEYSDSLVISGYDLNEYKARALQVMAQVPDYVLAVIVACVEADGHMDTVWVQSIPRKRVR
ncbi:hypothetical protein [Actinomadura rubrisoli]|uniref:Uncharacterized protein n=1 Tax=Actinomadura rubrisoli TaxID=2530368 RepID=A0A4R5CB86_9ACTN|nr:hypothetical protein [Actinomadura rubrisoli]TDD97208.1 hypothetical protein E1298_01865 [Actinomadura rubrisoli]